ncbi:hypothetical protein JCM10213_008252 [Rhodosporidiobolus nylandii]
MASALERGDGAFEGYLAEPTVTGQFAGEVEVAHKGREEDVEQGKPKINLIHLPSSVLRRIFIDPPTPTTYPSFLFAQFAAACMADPHKLNWVQCLLLFHPEVFSGLEGEAQEREKPGDLGSGQVLQDGANVFNGSRPYDPASVKVGFGLLKDISRSMTNLTTLHVAGEAFFPHLFSARFLQKRPYPRVTDLTIRETGLQPLTSNDRGTLLYRVSTIPSVRLLHLGFANNRHLPLTLLDLDPSALLAPRTWHLTRLKIDSNGWGGPELRHLFASLSGTLQKANIHFIELSPSFPDDLACLPPSLRALKLTAGQICPYATSDPAYPSLGSVLRSFPQLRQLKLAGDIGNLDILTSLSHLLHLESLILGTHLALFLQPLTALLDPASPCRLPHLKYLVVNICECTQESYDDPEAYYWSPVAAPSPHFTWPATFTPSDGYDLLRCAATAGLELEGTMRCALGMCGTSEKHRRICMGFAVGGAIDGARSIKK